MLGIEGAEESGGQEVGGVVVREEVVDFGGVDDVPLGAGDGARVVDEGEERGEVRAGSLFVLDLAVGVL